MYAASHIQGNYYGYPTYSYDLMLVAHETGHTLGEPHTHACQWMMGNGGTCGAIDDCTTVEPGSPAALVAPRITIRRRHHRGRER